MRTSCASLLVLPLLLALAGCGGTDDAANADAAAEPAHAADASAEPVEPAPGFDDLPPLIQLDASHLDPLARGLSAENAHLEQAVRRLQAARSDGDQLEALSDIEAARLDAIGADAAGFEPHEYRRLRDALYEHLGAVDTRVALEAQYGHTDTTGLDEATAAEARRQAAEVMAALPDPYVDMDPTLADALRQRQPELATLRATNIGLLFEAVDH